MKIVAVILVRMGSTRLPGKVMRIVEGRPLLGHLITRLSMVDELDGLVVATSTLPENDSIAEFCCLERIPCYRGDEDDVLGRMLGALQSQKADVGINVFGDGPLIDPNIVRLLIQQYSIDFESYDFISNDLKTTWPPGMEAEIFNIASIIDADRRCKSSAEREHSTLFIRKHPEIYRLRNIEAPDDLRRPDLSLEVDSEVDIQVVQSIISHFHGRLDYGLSDILSFLDSNRDITQINKDVPRRWKALRNDN